MRVAIKIIVNGIGLYISSLDQILQSASPALADARNYRSLTEEMA